MAEELYFQENPVENLEELPDPEKEEDIYDHYFQDLDNFELDEVAEDLAAAIGYGFKFHDQGEYDKALKCFSYVDVNQFPFLDQEEAFEAAKMYNEALKQKDEIEVENLANEFEGLDVTEISPDHLDREDIFQDEEWHMSERDREQKKYKEKNSFDTIEGKFMRRAWIASSSIEDEERREELTEKYGENYTEFWRKHKLLDEDQNSNKYKNELMESMEAMSEILNVEKYSDKQKSGRGGPGLLAPLLSCQIYNLIEKNDSNVKVSELIFEMILERRIG